VYIRDGTTMHASLAEQLTVLPAVTVAAMSMGTSAKVSIAYYNIVHAVAVSVYAAANIA
jgi:hypothetical protein